MVQWGNYISNSLSILPKKDTTKMRQAQDSTPVLWLQTQSAVSSIQHCFPRESAVGSNRTWWPDRGSNGVGMGRISFFGKSLNPRDNSGIYHTGLLWWWNESQSAIAIIATTTTTRHLLSPCYKPDNSEYFMIQLIITTTLYDRSHYFCCCYYHYWLLDRR